MARILFAEDDRAMQEMVRDMLGAAGHSVRTVDGGKEALEQIQIDPPDLTILDYRMGNPDGFEVCRRIKADPRLEHLPILILTAEEDMEDRIDGFAAGANDYLTKPFDSRELIARVGALLRLSEQGRDLNPTTGLPGNPAIEREFERRQRLGQPFSLCYLDLDHFKPFNDHFGFPTANAIIETLGQALRRLVSGSNDFAGHIGGDDFVLMCERSSGRGLMEAAQKEVHRALERMVDPEVIARGSFPGRHRDGTPADIPLTKLAGVLLHIDPSTAPPFAELGERAAEAKHEAKRSSDIVEREIR